MKSRQAVSRGLVGAVVVSICWAAGAGAPVAGTAPAKALPAVPPRPADAPSGTEFARATARMTGPERQRVGVAEILRGNVPDFVRSLRPVELSAHLPSGRKAAATVWVTPDYVAVGSDEDFLRLPLTWPSVLAVARAFGCLPPTPRIVDAVWAQADVHLVPAPLPPGPKMRSSEYYLRHRTLIEGQRGDLAPEVLVAGHKKDVVLSPRLSRRPGRIAIYGWHRRDGRPIQPLSTVHGARYADYSHGLRLVLETAEIDGEPVPLLAALADPELAPLFSDAGPIREAPALLSIDGR